MIIVQTPLRVSFVGGGTDFEEFYLEHSGAVVSTAIDKYVYVIVKERFDDMIYLNYSKKEKVDKVDDIEHELMREAMRIAGVSSGVEITTLADIPSEGTGLGSSSSITVGLLHCLHSYQGEIKTREILAHEACQVEIDIVGKPIGRQDQYIAAYGNMRFISFGESGIQVEKLELTSEEKERLNSELLLFNTGITRKAEGILLEQKANIKERLEILDMMRRLALKAKDAVLECAFEDFGEILHQGWELKKKLANGISNSKIDEIYEVARKAGAIGGKVTGAGGGGFILLYCPKGKQDELSRALRGLRKMPFRFAHDGSKVIFDYGGRS